MEDQHEATPGEGSQDAHADIYGEDGVIRASFLAHIGAAIADRDTLTLKREVAGLHQSELGDLLEALLPEQRLALVELLGKDFDFSALTEVDEAIRLDIVDNLPNEQIAAGGAGARFRRRGLHPGRPRPGGPGRDPGAAAVHRAHQAAPLARLSGGERRPAHADRVRRRAAVLDGRPDHRLHARGPEPPRPFQPDLRHRPDLQAARRDRPRPDPAHQARGEGRRRDARDAARHPRHDGPGRGGAGIRAIRPSCPPPSSTRTSGWSAC